ncbi:hypothetical protein [Bradyrhizobium sp. USDA 4454]
MTTVYFARKTSVASPSLSGNYVYHNFLMKTDGTTAGTTQVEVSQNRSSVYGIQLFGAYGNEAIFTPAEGDTYADNLWISDGTVAGTGPVRPPAATSSAPSGATVLNGKIIYEALGILWSSDGTAAGTTSLATLYGNYGRRLISDSVIIGNVEYFIATYEAIDTLGNPTGVYNAALWKTDGTAAGTVEVQFLSSNTNKRSHLGSVSSNIAGNPAEALFWYDTSTFGNAPELWETDGTTTARLMAFAAGATRSGSDFTQVGSLAYFTIDDGTHGVELWKTLSSNSLVSGGSPRTALVADIASGSTSSNPANLTASNGWLFFTANDGTHGVELWKTNGLTTTLVSDIGPGSAGSNPANLTDVNGTLYFTADDGVHGRELWKTTGSAATLITDLPGGGSNPTNLTNVNGVLYFEAVDASGSYGLYSSNGTTAGTIEIATAVDPAAGIAFEKVGTPIAGDTGNNILSGTSDAEFIDGSYGNDTIYGQLGDDTLLGGVGNDLVVGGGGNDYLYAGDGLDSMFGGGGSDILVGGVGYDLLEGDDGNDYLYVYNGGGNLYGGTGNDVLVGNLNVDVLNGDAGDDVMYAYGGNDYEYGGDGNDVIYGGDGVDVLIGNAGNDYFDGGSGVNYYFGGNGGGPGAGIGNDTFVVANTPGTSVQVVQDWTAGLDTVQFVGSGFSSFSDVLAHSYQNGAYLVVQVDDDTAIWLNGATAATVTAANFSFQS